MAVGRGDIIGRGGCLEQLQGDSFGCSIRMSREIGQVGECVVARLGWWCCVYIWMLGGSRQGQRGHLSLPPLGVRSELSSFPQANTGWTAVGVTCASSEGTCRFISL